MNIKERWQVLGTKEKVFWVTIYVFVIAVILILGAWFAQIIGVAIKG